MIAQHHDNLLFHNHVKDTFRYAYPLIQYKRDQSRAGILGINEGAVALRKARTTIEQKLQLGKRHIDLCIHSIKNEEMAIRSLDTSLLYHITNWIPLNQENYREYQRENSLTVRIQLLEKILIGNILSFAKGIGCSINDTIKCQIVDISAQYISFYKNVELKSFDLTFQCNVLLPEYIGLGKGASLNHGTITIADLTTP